MKFAVSMPDDVFRCANRLAKKLRVSRSRMVANAVREYVARHDGAEITKRINEALERAGENGDPAVVAAGTATLRRSEWPRGPLLAP